ncbi:MAG: 2-polyprenyl-3-methyl-6-methoxy-1,4-benzoquinone monooxygenase [Proteobacteria bacterium]|nr:2-polyprenyl-3-methyl-6-methoxy-1,4-benzoquinone monooxygenase [Pseudomonadota bacterium]
MGLSQCIRTLQHLPSHKQGEMRSIPGNQLEMSDLSTAEKKQSAALMRINHTGEVCAQALYLGQSLTARSNDLREKFSQSAKEESDHLYWCEQRIHDLGGRTSYLNPLWFTGSLFIGTVAGLIGDKWSLGFLAQTEKQVGAHLSKHLQALPEKDLQSRNIVFIMKQEEAMHEKMAMENGAAILPQSMTWGMQLLAKVMTSVTYYV